ncbi:uncharacterized protein [Clytia hemisphaerica]|uniref:uncharacterized protein n=1 Tax=Clytia hemisphaerica TaxID=252671 RepID=UPI0034D4F686
MENENLSHLNELLTKIDVQKHFPKISDEQFKWFGYGLGKSFGQIDNEIELQELIQSFMFSGSFMEGAAFARLMNPNLKKEYIEFEFDMMFPMGRIIEGHEDSVIKNLEYSKGFAWLRYDSKDIHFEPSNGRKVEEFLYKHTDDHQYLDSKSFKEDTNMTVFPDKKYFSKFQEELQGPSNNLDATMLLKQMVLDLKATKKADLQRAVQILNGLLGIIQRADIQMHKYYQHIVQQFTEFKKNMEKQFSESKTDTVPQETPAEPDTKTDTVPQETPAKPDTKTDTVRQETPAKPDTKTDTVRQETPAEPDTKTDTVPQETPAKPDTKTDTVPQETPAKPDTKTDTVRQETPAEPEISSKNENHIPDLDIEEFLCKVLPTSREKINDYLHLHWALIGFINEMIFCLRVIQITLTKNNLEKSLGFWSYAFMPLLEHGKTLEPKLVEFILHLFSLPRQMSECNVEGNKQSFYETFFKETIEKIPLEVAKALKLFHRCMIVLGPRFVIVQAICSDTKDDDDFNIPDQNELSLNIDRVPAIAVVNLPHFCQNFKDRERAWPPQAILDKIFSSGFHLVPKPSSVGERNENLDWRWSFSNAEMILANTRNDKMDMSYLFLKSILYVYLKAFECDDKTLPSYFAKTTLMWVCEQYPEKWWNEHSLFESVSVLLDQMRYFFEDEFLPHYFIQGLNLFDGVPGELIEFGKAVFISICQDPWICILEIANKLANMETVKKDEKTPVKTDPVHRLFGREGTEEKLKQQGSNMPLTIAELRQAFEARKIRFKDTPAKQGLLLLLQEIYENIADMWPKDFAESLSLEPPEYVADIKDMSFSLQMNDVQSELTHTHVYNFKFKGSTGLTLEIDSRR